ncbi:flagellar hook-basal body complex protein FliE [mine drainage metagenome]|uniref:Flagellar hook-basal body complex protein FliE n=1 Tax=mine drainage metagenome TaxID=410659 RepID=A0A1J5QY14_9ZZZZ
MSIPAIPPIAPVTAPIAPTAPTASSAAADASAAAGANFGNSLAGAVDQLQAVQGRSDTLAVQAATGQLANPQDYLLASTEASLTVQLTVAVRNKAIEAFNEIMRMPI